VLVDRPVQVQVHPAAGDGDLGFVDEPSTVRRVVCRTRGVDELRHDRLHPPLDGDVIDLDAAFSQQLLPAR
jgi:hypothetical protein